MNLLSGKTRRRSGPSKAECLLPQMGEGGRKRYLLGATTAEAPSRLIGYVSAGGIQNTSIRRRERKKRDRRGVVIAIAVVMILITIFFWG